MVAAANLVEVAALVGDTARATMLNALMGGQSLTATELAYCANVSRATASGHLSKLVAARLLTVTRERRFSYYRIASPLVATMLESLKVVAAIEVPPRRQPRSANEEALRFARSCYDHLAGQIGVTHFRFSMILGRPSCLQLALLGHPAMSAFRSLLGAQRTSGIYEYTP
jgi:DNA-binding transcriptional ArsR family regulator